MVPRTKSFLLVGARAKDVEFVPLALAPGTGSCEREGAEGAEGAAHNEMSDAAAASAASAVTAAHAQHRTSTKPTSSPLTLRIVRKRVCGRLSVGCARDTEPAALCLPARWKETTAVHDRGRLPGARAPRVLRPH
jgi:hypothetical protein